MEVLKLTQEVRDMLHEIPFINSGGCGYAALAIGHVLSKNLIPHKYVMGYIESNFISLQLNIEATNDNTKSPVAARHVFLYSQGSFLDVNGLVDLEAFDCLQFCEASFLREAIKSDTWNNLFMNSEKARIETIDSFFGYPMLMPLYQAKHNKA